jgi:endoglucanase
MQRTAILCGLLLALISSAHAALPLMGVNLAGAEFGHAGTSSYGLPLSILPGTYGTTYIYPNQTEVDYYLSKGMNTFRLPFQWERLQPNLSTGTFDANQLGYITSFIAQTTSKGGYVILDPHNYGQYTMNGVSYPIGSPQVTVDQYAAFWAQLGGIFRNNDHVLFGLMNEPAGTPLISTENWFTAAQAAVNAIRDPLKGNAHNTILVPGNYYTGAWSWTIGNSNGTPNSQVMGAINDPSDKILYEVHQYLDSNYSGTSPTINHDPVATLTPFTEWLRATGNKGFLGEFAVAQGATQQAAVTAMLSYMQAPENAGLWEGWTWWAGGPWWGDYMFSLEPNNGVDAPQMAYLAPYLAVPEPGTWALLTFGCGALWLLRKRRR